MYKFFRQYQKQTLAFFMVILMIAFIIPSRFGSSQGNDDQVIGKIGDEKVMRNSVRAAADQWGLVKNIVHRVRNSGDEQWQPAYAALPSQLIDDLQTKPEKYYLLQEEARKMGLQPDLQHAEEYLTDPNVGIQMENGSVISYDSIPTEDGRNRVQYSVANLMMVISAFQRAVDAVKISEPMAKHDLAAEYQKIKVRVVDFPDKDYDSRVPAPTPQQLTQQFDRFADFEADVLPSEVNPFGFGYKYPNRVKLQYIGVPAPRCTKRSWRARMITPGKSKRIDIISTTPMTSPRPSRCRTISFHLSNPQLSRRPNRSLKFASR